MIPFKIEVPDEVLTDLRHRLAHARFPDEFANDDWNYGANLAYLKELCAYWRERFDWRKQEALLNSFAHFTTQIDDRRLHFIHQRSKHENAFPLLITHGWPGSVFEFYKILGPLTDPTAHGGRAEDAFHVICPSMPGYGWSEAPREPGFDIRSVAETNIKLMDQLGYARYGAQGGDWGAVATAWMGALAPKGLAGIHMNMLVAFPPQENTFDGVTREEAAQLASFRDLQEVLTGYQAIQRTKPQTLGYGLTDSPLGLAGWITEKFHGWSDCHGDIESRFTKDELLTNIMIYWTTGNITSSLRLYCETHRSGRGRRGINLEKIAVPTGCAVFPVELYHAPRVWMDQAYNVTHWTVMPKGGHFAALEEPQLLVDDIRNFFRTLR